MTILGGFIHKNGLIALGSSELYNNDLDIFVRTVVQATRNYDSFTHTRLSSGSNRLNGKGRLIEDMTVLDQYYNVITNTQLGDSVIGVEDSPDNVTFTEQTSLTIPTVTTDAFENLTEVELNKDDWAQLFLDGLSTGTITMGNSVRVHLK